MNEKNKNKILKVMKKLEMAVFQAELRICEFHSEGTTKVALVYKSI